MTLSSCAKHTLFWLKCCHPQSVKMWRFSVFDICAISKETERSSAPKPDAIKKKKYCILKPLCHQPLWLGHILYSLCFFSFTSPATLFFFFFPAGCPLRLHPGINGPHVCQICRTQITSKAAGEHRLSVEGMCSHTQKNSEMYPQQLPRAAENCNHSKLQLHAHRNSSISAT